MLGQDSRDTNHIKWRNGATPNTARASVIYVNFAFACVLAASGNLNAQVILDAGFENYSVPLGWHVSNPSDGPWLFSGLSGVINPPGTTQGAPPSYDGPPAAEGSQYALIQHAVVNGTFTGSIEQAVLIGRSGRFRARWLESARPLSTPVNKGDVIYRATLGSAILGEYQTVTGQQWLVREATVRVPAGNSAVRFQTIGGIGSDNTGFIDDVQLNADCEQLDWCLWFELVRYVKLDGILAFGRR